jgi:polyisoprenoid-binding protein YceI
MIRRVFLYFLLASSVSLAANADSKPAKAKRFAMIDGEVGFVCEGPNVAVPAWGHFSTVESALRLDPKDLSKASGHIDVYMVSIRTDDAAWDTMFRRAAFLEVDENPKSRFVLESVRDAAKLEPGEWTSMTLVGTFELHGVTRKVVVPATAKWLPRDGQKKAQLRVRAGFHVTWDEYEIAVPTGGTRTFAGDGALIYADLRYRVSRASASPAKRKPRNSQ